MKFKLGDKVKIVKDKYGVLSHVVGEKGTITWVGDTTKGRDIRLQPEYHVELEDKRKYIVLEEEIENA